MKPGPASARRRRRGGVERRLRLGSGHRWLGLDAPVAMVPRSGQRRGSSRGGRGHRQGPPGQVGHADDPHLGYPAETIHPAMEGSLVQRVVDRLAWVEEAVAVDGVTAVLTGLNQPIGQAGQHRTGQQRCAPNPR